MATIQDVAQRAGVSVSTVESDSRKATAYLRSQLSEGGGDEPGAL